jgi:MoaA/NifB/PqqE/SkfB family radical SAM enzyme
MVISPSMRCNLNCYGCYAGTYTKDDELSFDEVDSIIQQGKDIGIHFVVISGGEPYAWEPLFDIFAKHRDVFFQTYTNGTLIDENRVEKLARLGNVLPAISCEGFEAETDRRRGKGTFARVNAVMDGLKDKGVMFAYSATATSQNLDTVSSDEFVDYWAEKGCLLGWYFMYIPIGKAPALDLMLSPEQRVELSRRLKDLRRRKPLLVLDFWNDGEYTRGCISGGRKYFHINNRGDVEPCVFCHFAADNIRETPLAEALNGPFFRTIRAAQPFDPDYRRPCMLVDKPEVLRRAVAETGAHPTHPGAEGLITELAPFLDQYAEGFHEALKDGPVTHLTRAV